MTYIPHNNYAIVLAFRDFASYSTSVSPKQGARIP
jgi:hypothetical protein